MKKIAAVLLVAAALPCRGITPLAKEGSPQAEIVIDEQAHPAVSYAAEELQHWVREISGAQLPVVHAPGKAPSQLVLAVNPKQFPADLEKLRGNDGYAVRTVGNTAYLFASCPKGVLNGVFRMLFKNTDIIWARPNVEFGTVFTKNPNLALTDTDYIDVPVYVLRGWQMPGMPSTIWQVRNGANWTADTIYYDPAWVKYGTFFEFGGGHNLVGVYIPEKKYYATNPEFYPLREGKRLKPSENVNLTQLCFTNRKLLETFIRELDDRVKANPDYDTYRIMIEDNYNLCECPECLKPIKLPNGETVNPKDKDFRSTQFFLWLNHIARHMRENYPAKRILTFAYFFTEIPPRYPLEPNISISFCPISKNSKAPMDSPDNAQWNNQFLGWTRIGAQLTWREYFGLVGPFPRPIDVIAMADWKYANRHGINRTYSEMRPDTGNGIKTWDVNSLYFWVMANGAWNPDQDVKALRQEFLKRVYGPAADDVAEFYGIVEDGWFKAGGNSRWDDRTIVSWHTAVIKRGTEKTCRAALERAATKVTHPNGKRMLAALRHTFEEQIGRGIAGFAGCAITAGKVSVPPAFDPDFNSGEWEKAEVSSNFFLYNDNEIQEPTREKTALRLLYDDRNLYVGVKCFDREPAKAYAKPAGQPRDEWPVGDKFEIFLTGLNQHGKKCVYQIAFDINGNLYDSCDQDPKWDGDFQVVRRFTNDGWSAVATIPFRTLNLDAMDKPAISATFLRYWNQQSAKPEIGVWYSGVPHNANTFGEIKLAPLHN